MKNIETWQHLSKITDDSSKAIEHISNYQKETGGELIILQHLREHYVEDVSQASPRNAIEITINDDVAIAPLSSVLTGLRDLVEEAHKKNNDNAVPRTIIVFNRILEDIVENDSKEVRILWEQSRAANIKLIAIGRGYASDILENVITGNSLHC